ncbi:serine/threonine protein kinase [Haliangium ochraceum DSM 14365]|uniref:Serine/threonine protein kinase n=2 Tax=Haliangium ochraceum TaxID=80816 RepID=D0LZ39_HALO1|nr:serine/threonine protein kinase [Haliangium ochraceum DSM 14365]
MRQPVPFGKYLLLDRVSVGGMAEIFKAMSYGVEGFEKLIAIKRILPSMGEDSEFIKMFIDEAKIVGLLSHANICQIFELGCIESTHFIAMEYIWGKDLLQMQNRLKKNEEYLPPAMACHIIARVCEGLDYAHRKRDPMGNQLKIVHRDCSPQNILVSYEGEVKIIDFGIAKAASRSSRTMAGVLKGKFGYMSPEQVRGLPLDRRSDIFALGTVFYEILTRERLFHAESDYSTLEKVRNVDIQPPRTLNPSIPAEVEAIVMKALAPDPDDRYQWCSDMLGDLQRFLMSQESAFTAKMLSSWMKQAFERELARERRLMEDYKSLGRDGLVSNGNQQRSAAAEEPEVIEVVGEDGGFGDSEAEPTMLGGPDFDSLLGGGSGGGQAAEDDENLDFAEEAPTEIFGEVETNEEEAEKVDRIVAELAQPAVQAADAMPSTTLLQSSGAAAQQLRQAIEQAGPGPGHPRDASPVPGSLGAAVQAESRHPSSGHQLQAHHPGQGPGQGHYGQGQGGFPQHGAHPQAVPGAQYDMTDAVPRLSPGQVRRPGGNGTLAKDIAIGIGIALLVVGLFMVVNFFFLTDKPAPPPPAAELLGSIAVSIPENKQATLTVDGRLIGEIAGGEPHIVSDLVMGNHLVEITQPGTAPCRVPVTLDGQNVAVNVDCPLEALSALVVIEGVTAEHDVRVDGESVAAEARTEPLQIVPGKTHEIVVMSGEEVLGQFSIEANPGEVVRRKLGGEGEDEGGGDDEGIIIMEE